MSQPNSDPMPGIRAVLVTGFVSGIFVGLVYLTLEGHLLESLQLNPISLFGAILAVGIAGMMVGTACGLFVRLLLEKQGSPVNWQLPVVVCAATSAIVGFLISHTIISALW